MLAMLLVIQLSLVLLNKSLYFQIISLDSILNKKSATFSKNWCLISKNSPKG